MELFQVLKTAREDPKADWSKRRGVSKVFKHFKIIGVRKLTKNDMDHENPNFRVFLAYGTPEKIVRDTETRRGRNPRLIWPFWTQRQNWFFVSEYGLEDIEGKPLIVEIQDLTVKIQTYLY